MIIEAGEFLHTYLATGMIGFITFLIGLQVGSIGKSHEKTD